MTALPPLDRVTPATPLRLSVAAAIAYPDGSMTGEDLFRQFEAGRLTIERVAGMDYTTLEFIKEMEDLRSMFFGAEGNIYFVGYGPYVKIGFTKGDVSKRLRGLSTGCPEAITVYAVKRGLYDEERALHKRFLGLWVRGEWFRHEGDLADFIVGLRK